MSRGEMRCEDGRLKLEPYGINVALLTFGISHQGFSSFQFRIFLLLYDYTNIGAFAIKICENAPVSFFTSVHLSACNVSRITKRIFMKLDTGEMSQNSSKYSNFD